MVEPQRSIGDHGVIGDMETAALVATYGTIDYLCWPSLDSPTIFADLLDPKKGGAFSIKPKLSEARNVQLYIPDTNVLITRWLAGEGNAEVADLMTHPDTQVGRATPLRGIIRRVTAIQGSIQFEACCAPRFDYAKRVPDTEQLDGGVRFTSPHLALRLFSSAPMTSAEGAAWATFTLEAGQSVWFVLGGDDLQRPDNDRVAAEIEATTSTWRSWAAKASYTGRWREEVLRSALALKLLTSRRHGSVAAAATFSLPEAIGGERNWDYRATWIRDASFTVYAFMRLGYVEELSTSPSGRASASWRPTKNIRCASCMPWTARKLRTSRSCLI